MKTQIKLAILMIFISMATLKAQVNILSNSIGIKTTGQLSELAINDPGLAQITAYIQSDDDVNGSTAIYAKAFESTGFGDASTAILGVADFGNSATFSHGVYGSSIRTSAGAAGRTYGVRGRAGNGTSGSNFGVYASLEGSNMGTAVFGWDKVAFPAENELIGNTNSYAGYFIGKGYFHDNLGIGQNDPNSRLQVKGGDVYVEDSGCGVILKDANSDCWKITVDVTGNLISTLMASCP